MIRQGCLDTSARSLAVGLVQLQIPDVQTAADLAAQTRRLGALVGEARRRYPRLQLLVFPEYSLQGISMDTDANLMCRRDGAEITALRAACRQHRLWAAFSVMEYNPNGNPYNAGLIIDSDGEIRLFMRKLHPWFPIEPWQPGDLGIPVCDGPAGARLALITSHDGMHPEVARECAYKGANLLLRVGGYTSPMRHAWKITSQANSYCNRMISANVCLASGENLYNSLVGAMVVDFDGVPIAEGNGLPDEILVASTRPDLADEARRAQAVEHDIDIADCPYTHMRDLVAGRQRPASAWIRDDTLRLRSVR